MDDTHETAFMHVDKAIYHWCPTCLKTTLARSSIYALTSAGPRRVGEWAICQECAYSPYSAQEDQ